MSKFSARKPLTIFAAVIVVIVLGVVSLTNMTPDLLPNMDMPYIVLMTTYAGATPQEVETAVTSPLEQRMATLEHIKTIESTSSANVSMIVMEFDSAVNMDTVSVDILQQVDMISGQWEENVGVPRILKINPSMLPVMVSAVDVEGMDTIELSEFVSNTLLPQLQGISGVASVSANGIIKEDIAVSLNKDKISSVNEKVALAIRKELAESKEELDEAQEKIDDGKSKIKKSKKDLEGNKQSTFDELTEAGKMINEAISQSIAYNAQLSGLLASQGALQTEKTLYESGLEEISSGITEIDGALEDIVAMRAMINPLVVSGDTDDTALSSLPIDPAAMAMLAAYGCETLGDVRALDADLADQQTTLAAQKDALLSQKSDAENRIGQLDAELANFETKIAAIRAIVEQIDAAITEAQGNYASVESGKLAAAVGFGAGSAQLAAAEAELDKAQESLESAVEQYEDAVEKALLSADLEKTITIDTISEILTAQNFSMPAGYVYEDGLSYQVSVGDKFTSREQLEELMLINLGIEGVEPIYLKEVADISVTDNSDSVYTTINGNAGVALMFSKQSAHSTAEVTDSIKAKFEELTQKHEGLSFSNLMDQGKYIYMITGSITDSLLWGALFAVLILFLFLKDIRPTFITLCSIPISVIFAIVLMYFSGVTLNIMSLSGLAVAVGMLVDNSIVVIENTYRLRLLGEPSVKAAISGAVQVGGAIVASTLTTICVFVPIIFIEGITRQLFSEMALTLGFSLIASLIIALTLVPAMSAKLLKTRKERSNRAFNMLKSWYTRSVTWALKFKALVLGLTVLLLVISTMLALSRGFSFMPETSSNQISVTMEVPEETSFQDKAKMANDVAKRLKAVEEIETIGAILSTQETGMFASSDETSVDFYVILDENAKRTSREIIPDIIALTADMECTIDAQDSSMMTGYRDFLGGSGITVNVFNDDLDSLQQSVIDIAKQFKTLEGVKEVNDGLEDTDPEIHFSVDKNAAMQEGLTTAQVYMEIVRALTLEKKSISIVEDGNYDVLIMRGTEDDLTPDYIKNLSITVKDKDGEEKDIKVGDIASVEEKQTLSSVNRTDQRRYISVSATIEEGYNATHVTADAQKLLKETKLPSGTSCEFAGENESVMESLGDLAFMLLIGLILIYLIMVAQFQSLKSPFIVFFTIPLAFTGGFLALLVTGFEVSVISMIGFIMLSGIIVNNGIVLVDYINRLREEGMPRREAIVQASITRMRPILMTSITTILGLIVLALGLSEGAAIMQPLAIVCIGGLTYATLMTLYVVPAIYDMMNKKQVKTIDAKDLEISEK